MSSIFKGDFHQDKTWFSEGHYNIMLTKWTAWSGIQVNISSGVVARAGFIQEGGLQIREHSRVFMAVFENIFENIFRANI